VLLNCGIDAEMVDMGLLSAARLRLGRRNRGCIHRECGKSHPVTGALAATWGARERHGAQPSPLS
jgi:hypothetical protein